MRILSDFFKCIVCISILGFCSCDSVNKDIQANDTETNTDIENLSFEVEEAPEWSALFNRTSGWFGADGTYSIPLNGKDNATVKATTKTMLLFSNTLIGEISNGRLDSNISFINNSAALLIGNEPKENAVDFYWNKSEEDKPQSLFIPNTPSAKKGEDYYWMGDGFINTALGNATYIFGSRMRTVSEEEWGFSLMGTALIVLPPNSKPPFQDQRQIEIPFFFDAESPDEKGAFGAGIFVNTKDAGAPDPDGYLYIYGVKGKNKDLMVARVQPKDIEDFNAWRFWDGKEWNNDIEQATSVTQNVSHELSVSVLPDGRYALVFQVNAMSPKIGLRLGETPYGPFGPVIDIYETEGLKKENYVTYNAKAHPHLSNPGELLISYNVNAFDFFNEIKANPNLYRPRFIRVKLQQ